MTPSILHVAVPRVSEQEKLSRQALMEQMLQNIGKELSGKQISLECVGYNQTIHFFVACDKELQPTVESMFYVAFPEAELSEVNDYTDKIDPSSTHIRAALMELERADTYPIQFYDLRRETAPPQSASASADDSGQHDTSTISQIFTAISTADPRDHLWLQIVLHFRQRSFFRQLWIHVIWAIGRSFRIVLPFEYIRPGGPEEARRERDAQATKKANMLPIQATIRCMCIAGDETRAERQLQTLINSLKQYNHHDLNGFTSTSIRNVRGFLREYRRRTLVAPFHFTPKETATVYYMPDPALVPNVVRVLSRKRSPPTDLPSDSANVIPFATTDYRKSRTPFGMYPEDRSRNMYVIGQSGSDKEILLEQLICGDMLRGDGVCVVDPHGDIIRSVLPFIPKERSGDVLLLDPTDEERLWAFNPFENIPEIHRLHVLNGLFNLMKMLMGEQWNQFMEQLMRFTFLALFDSDDETLLSIGDIFKNDEHRHRVAQKSRDPLTKQFWEKEFTGWTEQGEASTAVNTALNILEQLAASGPLKHIIGQPHSTFDLAAFIERRAIIFWNTPKGFLGEQGATVLGSLFLIRFLQEMFGKTATTESGRERQFHCFVDEFHSFALPGIQEFLAASQKFSLDLVLSHQQLSQLPEDLAQTIPGNVGTLAIFRVDRSDAETLAKEFEPTITPEDLSYLDKGKFYIRMPVRGAFRPPFSAQTLGLPPPTQAR